MRNRLCIGKPATFENIDSAEGEYEDYFISELKDELFLSGRILDYDTELDDIYKLLDLLVKDDGFNFGHLRTIISSYIDVKTGNKKILSFIRQLWWYGILGFRDEKRKLINFKYQKNSERYISDNNKKYSFYLHKGLWWFARKRKDREPARN